MTMNNQYDIIYSLGRDCSCAMYMQKAELRLCSGPFDWLTNAGFEERFELIFNNFAGFMDINNFKLMEKPTAFPSDDIHDYYENTQNHLYFWHDFPAGQSLEQSFPEVKAKYERRIKRFYTNIKTKDRVLLIWFSHLHNTDDKTILRYCNELCQKFAKNIDFLIIEHREGMPQPKTYKLAPNIEVWHCHSQKNDEHGVPLTLGDEATVLPIFKRKKLHIPLVRQLKKWLLKYSIKFACLFIPIKKWRKSLRKKIPN